MAYQEQTTFNMAIASLIRLDSILRLVSVASIQKDFPLWRDCLFDLDRQLSGFVTEKEQKKIEGYLEKIKTKKWNIKDAKGNCKINKSLSNDIYFLLHDATKEIYRIMGEKGLLMKRPENPRTAIIN